MEQKSLHTKQLAEANCRLDELTAAFHLNPHIKEYFNEGRIYYSYLTGGGMIGSIDTINYDPRYAKVVRNFEPHHGLVYHAIEYGNSLAVLYVSNFEFDWPSERLFKGKYISAYVHNFDYPDCSETGDILVSGFGESGALIRVG